MIILMILSIFIMLLIGYDEITENISELANVAGIPIAFLIKLTALCLLVIVALGFLLKIFKNKHSNLSIQTNKDSIILEKPLEKILIQINKTGEFRIGRTKHNLKYSDEQLRAYLGFLVGEKYIYSMERVSILNESFFKTYKMNSKGYNYLVSRKLI